MISWVFSFEPSPVIAFGFSSAKSLFSLSDGFFPVQQAESAPDLEFKSLILFKILFIYPMVEKQLPSASKNVPCLGPNIQQLHHRLWSLIGLSEHGGAGRKEDLIFNQITHLFGHIGVCEHRLGGHHIFFRNP